MAKSPDTAIATRLPLDDASVDGLSPATRRFVSFQWQERATSELRVASIFASIARELFETGADPVVLGLVARAVSDEVRHAEICRLLATRYGGTEVPWPPPAPVPMPRHGRASPELRPTLRVVAMGCINETIASAWLEASRADATSPLARAAIRELLSDDVNHARIGWAHLGSAHVTLALRAKIAGWLPRLLQTAALQWIRPPRDPRLAAAARRAESAEANFAVGVPSHGVPARATTRRVVGATLRDVVLPGFDAVGVNTSLARAWMADVFERAARS